MIAALTESLTGLTQVVEVCVLSVTVLINGSIHGSVDVVTLPFVCEMTDEQFSNSDIVRGWKISPEVGYRFERGFISVTLTTRGE